MYIGITTDIRHSMFSNGHTNTCISIAEVFHHTGHEVVFIHKEEGRSWWDDVNELAKDLPRIVLLSEFLKEGRPVDLLIEVGFFLSSLTRPTVAKRCVWYNRKPGLFTDLESSVYGCRPEGRDLEGINEIWTADLFTTREDLVFLQTLYPAIPITVVPWLWTPIIVETHRKQLQSQVWLNGYLASAPTSPWSIHVTESNASNTSSCTLPMTILKHAIESKPFPVSNIFLHNTELLKKNKFFLENVYSHTKIADISSNLVGRQRVIDWVYDQKSLVVSHTRFSRLKIANLEAAWVGIPVVHNNPVLQELGMGLELLYYKDNSITGATRALQTAVFETASVPYLTSLESLTELRKAILDRFHPEIHIQRWNEVASGVTLERSVSLPFSKQETRVDKSFHILFTDMWENFNASYNMFTLATESALESQGVKVNGYSVQTLPKGLVPDVVVLGPFGEEYTLLPDEWPKVHFTGENTDPKEGHGIQLNLGFQYKQSESYFRMPLWMFEIDWFGADMKQIQNPLLIPVDTCIKASPSERSKFCAFIVSNPGNPIRNRAFEILNSYKPVDGAGRVYNTIGNTLFAGLGGGGGELMKHEFLKDYKFSITYENSLSEGYTTEKLLHAKAAGCVPIYCGNPLVGKDFDERGFLNATSYKTEEELIQRVKELDESADLWAQYSSVPVITLEKRDEVRTMFSVMVRRFLNMSGKISWISGVPELLGASSSEEADKMREKRYSRETQVVSTTTVEKETLLTNPVLVTGVSQRFWPSLIMWLDSIQSHKQAVPGLSVRVYVASDVADTSIQRTSEKYTVAEFIRFPTETPTDFPDYWDLKHYAWKLWIYKTMATDLAMKDRLILYLDSASILVRWPLEWMQKAVSSGVSFLNDSTQINATWCHSAFCKALEVTDAEKQENQILAGLGAFVSGDTRAVELFTSAYEWSKKREVISGEKWLPDGTGHRHDQSILSILTQRLRVARVPMETVYCDTSLRATFHSGRSVYIHRGNFVSHKPYIQGIDEVFLINMDRREDRKQSFLHAHPDLKGIARRLPAYDGRKIVLGPHLARLFQPNDFHWKKSVMGCALSHLNLLYRLVNESPDIQSYCILEDDARLVPGWQARWLDVYPRLPEGWDCIYLGGVLPPNKPGLAAVIERVAPGLALIAPNQSFGQQIPTRYYHFCTYAYVISRAGARKILDSITEKGGYWTSADHVMCNPVDRMNNYLLDPLVAGASQDDDPVYQNSDFNNFNREDKFDSDIWNNNERFSADEVTVQLSKKAPLSIAESLREA